MHLTSPRSASGSLLQGKRLALAASILVLTALSGCGEIKSATEHLISGNEAFQQGDYKQAEIEYRKALKQEPNSSTALNNLGVILNELGKYDEAIDILHKAIGNDPKNWIAHDALAEALSKRGKYDEAIGEAHKSVELAPSELRGHRALAQAFLLKAQQDSNKDELKAAIDEYRYILSIDADDAVSHQNLGEAYLLENDKEGALTEAKKAVELNPDSVEARKVLATALHHNKDNSAAVKELDWVIGKNPADNDARTKRKEYTKN